MRMTTTLNSFFLHHVLQCASVQKCSPLEATPEGRGLVLGRALGDGRTGSGMAVNMRAEAVGGGAAQGVLPGVEVATLWSRGLPTQFHSKNINNCGNKMNNTARGKHPPQPKHTPTERLILRKQTFLGDHPENGPFSWPLVPSVLQCHGYAQAALQMFDTPPPGRF